MYGLAPMEKPTDEVYQVRQRARNCAAVLEGELGLRPHSEVTTTIRLLSSLGVNTALKPELTDCPCRPGSASY